MQTETTGFAERVFKYVDESTERLQKNLVAYWEETRGLQEQILALQHQDNLAGTRMEELDR